MFQEFCIHFSLAIVILATLVYNKASVFHDEPGLMVEAQMNKAFDESCLLGTFEISSDSHEPRGML